MKSRRAYSKSRSSSGGKKDEVNATASYEDRLAGLDSYTDLLDKEFCTYILRGGLPLFTIGMLAEKEAGPHTSHLEAKL